MVGNPAVIVYWIAFLVPALAVLSPFRATPAFGRFLWLILGLAFCLFIALRHEVGADWLNYLEQFEGVASGRIQFSEPGYGELNRLMATLGFDIHAVNLVCAVIFVAGLLYFCSQERYPWLAVAVAVPYLLIVVAMGYTKQAAALGLFLYGLARLQKGSTRSFIAAVLAATMFHVSAIVCMLFATLTIRRVTLRLVLITAIALVTLAVAVVAQQLDAIYGRLQTLSTLESAGAAVRLAMNVAAFVALLVYRHRWRREYGPIELWAWMGILSVIGLAFVPLASSAVDRTALYFSPLQLVVWARLPTLIHSRILRTEAVLLVLFTYAGVLGVWLNLGNNAARWLPYQNVLLDWLVP